jgi:hypothetical protein
VQITPVEKAAATNTREDTSVPATSYQLQESIELLAIHGIDQGSLPSPHIFGILKDKIETYAVVAPADGVGMHGDRALGDRLRGIREGHS